MKTNIENLLSVPAKVAQLNNTVAAYLGGDIKLPALYTNEKAQEKFIASQDTIGECLNLEQFVTATVQAITADASKEAKIVALKMQALAGSNKDLIKRIQAKESDYVKALVSAQKVAQETMHKVINTGTLSKILKRFDKEVEKTTENKEFIEKAEQIAKELVEA